MARPFDDDPDLEEIMLENEALETECHQLETDLDTLSASKPQKRAELEKIRDSLHRQNVELESQIKDQQTLLTNIKVMYLSVPASVLRRNGLAGDEGLREATKSLPQRKPNERLDRVLAQIVVSETYFKDCTTNSAFLDRCRQLMHDISDSECEPDQSSDTKRRLDLMEFQSFIARKSTKVANLIEEKGHANAYPPTKSVRAPLAQLDRVHRPPPPSSPFLVDDWTGSWTPSGRPSLFIQ
jgi:hypothetical protein